MADNNNADEGEDEASGGEDQPPPVPGGTPQDSPQASQAALSHRSQRPSQATLQADETEEHLPARSVSGMLLLSN